MLDQCSVSLWHARPARFQSREMPVLVRDMLASDSRQRRDARHAIRAATTVGCNRLAGIDMNNRGMRQVCLVQSGFKESPIAMG